jgi:beta-glucosidase
MNKLLKEELGFKGYVMSDWNAQHTTTGSANGGTSRIEEINLTCAD